MGDTFLCHLAKRQADPANIEVAFGGDRLCPVFNMFCLKNVSILIDGKTWSMAMLGNTRQSD